MHKSTDLTVLAAQAERQSTQDFYALCLAKHTAITGRISRERAAGRPYLFLLPEAVHQLDLAATTRHSLES